MLNIRVVLAMTFMLWFSSSALSGQKDSLRKYNFNYLDDVLAVAKYDVRYKGENNFLGRPVKGYHSSRLVLTQEAAMALKMVEVSLLDMGYGLLIYDTYRPQRAVDDFSKWAKTHGDTITRQQYYPDHDKRNLFKLGYISSRSGHSRGSTIDLTLYYIHTGHPVDMGGPYDYFGTLSHHDYLQLTSHQLKHRRLLKKAMLDHGFRAYSKEWWHYTLNGEPYKFTYFDFVVDKN